MDQKIPYVQRHWLIRLGILGGTAMGLLPLFFAVQCGGGGSSSEGGGGSANPTITSLNSSADLGVGGSTITVTGTNFQSGATVSLGGTNCTSTSFISATQLTCVVPANADTTAIESVTVMATNPDSSQASLSEGFHYLGATQLWLDATAATTLWQNIDCSGGGAPVAANTNGDPVRCWEDRNTTAIAATRTSGTPTWDETGQNAMGTVDFDGVAAFQVTGITLGSIFVVGQRTALSDTFIERGNGFNRSFGFNQFGAAFSIPTSYYLNGVLVTDGTNTTGTPILATGLVAAPYVGETVGIGEATFSYTNPVGHIAELMIYAATLTSAQRETVEKYLQGKWATPALP